MVMAEILPGRYDNANQQMFDARLKVAADQRQIRRHSTISRVAAPLLGPRVFLRQDRDGDEHGPVTRSTLYVLEADTVKRAVRLETRSFPPQIPLGAGNDKAAFAAVRPDQASRIPACDVFFIREVSQFAGRTRSGKCPLDPKRAGEGGDTEMLLSERGIWERESSPAGTESDRPFARMVRVREFECYADVPGVSGGRDIPFKRHENLRLHDQGGTATFDAVVDGRPTTIQLSLRSVDWPINNERDTFTRNSLVLYVAEKQGDAFVEGPYSWSEPRAERLGMNLRWMLVNCYTESRQAARPVF